MTIRSYPQDSNIKNGNSLQTQGVAVRTLLRSEFRRNAMQIFRRQPGSIEQDFIKHAIVSPAIAHRQAALVTRVEV